MPNSKLALAVALATSLALSPLALAEPPAPAAPAGPEAKLSKDQQRGLELGRKFLGRLESMFGLIRQNKGDCDKTMKLVSGWVDELGPELQAAAREMEALEKKMSEPERKAIGKLLEAEAEALMGSVTPVMMEFVQGCPQHMEALGKQMERLVPPAGGTAEAPPAEKAH